MRFWRTSLLSRLLIYFLLLAITPLAIVGLWAYNRGEEALKEHVLNHLTTTAILKEHEISRWIADLEQTVRLLAQNPVVREQAETLLTRPETSTAFASAYQSLRPYLYSVLAEKTDFMEIMILHGVGGKVLLATNPAHEGTYEVSSTFYQEGRKATYVQNIYPSVSLGQQTITIATPLPDKAGRTIGVLAVHLNLAKMNEIMGERSGLGTTGETYLVNRFNVFVSGARFGSELYPQGVHSFGIDEAILRGNSGAAIYDNYRGVPVAGSYRWLAERELALLAEIELDEALAPVRRLAMTIFMFGVIAAGVVTVIAYGVTRRISAPILDLAETATRIASGDLSQTVAVQRQDEIGVLARAFNSMTGQLRDLITGLEQRVADRTRELARRSVALEAAAEVGHAATSILDVDQLIRQVTELIRQRFDLYYVGLFLLDASGEWAVLRAGTGEAGRAMLARRHRIRVGEGMIGWCVAHDQARVALEMGEDAVRLATAELPLTRSEAALPLRSRGRVLGAITVQHTEPGAFDEATLTVLQTMADQVAVALDNARLFAEGQEALEATRRAYGELGRQAWIERVRSRPDTSYRRGPQGLVPASEVWRPHMVEALQTGRLTPGQGDQATAVAIPIRVRGQVIGVIDARKPATAGVWTTEELTLLETLTDQLGATLDSARLFEETQRRARDERELRAITAQVRDAPGLEAILQTAVQEVVRALGVERAFVQLGTPPPLERET